MKLTTVHSHFSLLLLLCSTHHFTQAADSDFLYSTFPSNFKWGMSVASYQTEGAWNEDGKGPSIWDTFTHQKPSPIFDGSTGDIACDTYHKWREDLALLSAMNANSFRFSLSWPRLLPNGTPSLVNKKALSYYNDMIDQLIALGIEPILTLYHWDLPEALQESTGGWPNEAMIQHFLAYASFAFSHFGDRVKTWITFNEPWAVCLFGYGEGVFAPGIKEMAELPYKCASTILKAHAETWHLFDSEFRPKFGGRLGMVVDSPWFEPADDAEDLAAAERALQFKHGFFASPLIFGKYPGIVEERIAAKSKEEGRERSRLPKLGGKWPEFMKGTLDFLGLNHYSTVMVKSSPLNGQPSWYNDQDLTTFQPESWPSSASSWLKAAPWGFRKLLNWIKTTYSNIEVLVTENGFSDSFDSGWEDEGRVAYFKGYINNLLKAVKVDGCNVTGYLGWSLLDNFEWAQGYSERFGVHWVNFSDPERARIPKKSAAFLKDVFTHNGFKQEKDMKAEL